MTLDVVLICSFTLLGTRCAHQCTERAWGTDPVSNGTLHSFSASKLWWSCTLQSSPFRSRLHYARECFDSKNSVTWLLFTWFSWRHRFPKAPFSKWFPFTWKSTPGVFKFLKTLSKCSVWAVGLGVEIKLRFQFFFRRSIHGDLSELNTSLDKYITWCIPKCYVIRIRSSRDAYLSSRAYVFLLIPYCLLSSYYTSLHWL